MAEDEGFDVHGALERIKTMTFEPTPPVPMHPQDYEDYVLKPWLEQQVADLDDPVRRVELTHVLVFEVPGGKAYRRP